MHRAAAGIIGEFAYHGIPGTYSYYSHRKLITTLIIKLYVYHHGDRSGFSFRLDLRQRKRFIRSINLVTRSTISFRLDSLIT